MRRAFQRWWHRHAERRGAARRSADVGRWRYEPFYRHSSFGKPRFGRFDTYFNPRRWLSRLAGLLLLAFLFWICWESWRGLALYN